MLRKMEPMGTRAVLKSWSHLMYCGRILAMDSSNDTGQKLRGAARCSGKHHRTVAAGKETLLSTTPSAQW
ncbi:hypothetical protein L916_03074 [Phytophthora nicotianae]|nr:hypothetical protein L916_03074 [Phytophthora nicotianae]